MFSDEKADQDPGLMEKLIANMIRNIQITVKNIHIRYEDSVSPFHHTSQQEKRILTFYMYAGHESLASLFIWYHSG